MILVGGEGRRMRPLTDTRPKPMLPLVDRPFVAHQLDHLRRHGVRDIVFSCGYRPDAIEAHFGDGAAAGVRLRYVVDPEPLGTAGAVGNAVDLLDPRPVLVLNGDILTDLDLDALIVAHDRAGAVGTIALTPVRDPSAFGLVRLRPDASVEAFLEKPTPGQLRPGEPYRINAGTYLLSPRALEAIPIGRASSIEREVFPALAAEGVLFGFPSDAYWRDIGTPASYLAAHLDVLAGAVRTESPSGRCHVGAGARVAADAYLDPLCSIGEDVVVESGAVLERSVVLADARIGAGARVSGAVVGAGADVGAGVVVDEGAVVGDGARIGMGARIEAGVRVATGEQIAPAPL